MKIARLALCLEYDGRPYSGWQSQPARPTVQGTVEQAIARFVGQDERIEIVAAGRTDTGVHAIGQIVHLDPPVERTAQAWVRGLNAMLPPSVAVRWAHPVSDDFHARFGAMRRAYVYRIHNHAVRSPLLDGRAAWCHRPLDHAAMERAATALLGEHDFSSFRASECQAKSPVKHVESVELRRAGALIELRITANAFLHHMVRNIVGSLVYVGLGRERDDWIAQLLAARDRRLAAPTYAAEGLYFARVDYPAHFGLPDTVGPDADVVPAMPTKEIR